MITAINEVKKIDKKRNVKTKSTNTYETILSMSPDLCYKFWYTVCMPEWIGDQLEIPETIDDFFVPFGERDIQEFQSLGFPSECVEAMKSYNPSNKYIKLGQNLANVIRYHKENKHNFWTDIYRMVILLDENVLKESLNGLSVKEIDVWLRSGLIIGNMFPCPDGDRELFDELDTFAESANIDKVTKILHTSLSDLTNNFIGINKQRIKTFCDYTASEMAKIFIYEKLL